MPDLFISYARADSRDFVARLSAALEERGKDTWVDLEDIPAASVWTDDLRTGIGSSDSFCFVISPASVSSEHCRTELEYAVGLGKRLLPVLHLPAPDPEVPEAVSVRNWIPQTGRFEDDFDLALATLLTAIETDLDWVREHTRWGLRATEWEHRAEDHSLLARGSDLDHAEAFLSGGGGKEPQPTELQGRYVLASRRAATRRQRQLVTGVSVALVVAIVLGVLALLQRNTAVEQRHEADEQRHQAETERAAATSRALAANAFLNLPTDPELSLLLGLEAAKASPTTEAETALRSAALASQARGQLRHDGAVNEASYGPDGTTILTLSEDVTAALWDARSGKRIAVLEGHTAPPQQAAWSADGSRVVTIAQDSTAVVYDGHTGAKLTTITDPDDYRLSHVLISADGSVVVTSGFVNQQVHFWSAADGTLLGTIPRTTVDTMALSPDQSLLLTAQQGESVELWSTTDLSLVASFPDDAQRPFTTAAFSPDGSEFVTAGGDGSANVRALDGTLLAFISAGGSINAAAFSPDGRRIATASDDGTAVVTDISDGTEVSRYAAHAGPVAAIAFSPTGDLVATGGQDGTVRLWRAETGAEVAALIGHQAPVSTVVFNAAGDRVLSASDDSTARLWATAGAAADFPELSSTDVPESFDDALSENARFALMAVTDDESFTTTARTLDVESGELVSEFVLDKDSTLVPVVSDDGELTVTTSSDSSVIRRTADGSVVAEIPVGELQDATFDSSGKRVVAVWAGGRAAVADARTGEVVTGLEGHDPAWEVVSGAFSPEGDRVATASLDGTVRVWDAETGEQLLALASFGPPPSHSSPGGTVVFSPDGRLIANALISENDARLWDADTGAALATLEGGKDGGVVGLGFSGDGRFLVTANSSGPVRLWDGRSGRFLAPVTPPDRAGGAVGFSTDSQDIAVLGSYGDGPMRVLDCTVCGDLDSLVDLARTRVTRELTDTERATYLSEG